MSKRSASDAPSSSDIADDPRSAAATPATETVPPEPYSLPFAPPAWLGWAVAACCLFAALFFAGKSFNVRGQLQSVLETERLSHLEAGTLKNLLEAERILSRGQLTQLAATEQRIVDLRARTDLARLQIVPLVAPASDSTDVGAIVVWSPDRQEGLFVGSKLPALPPDNSFQLWLNDAQHPAPVAAGAVMIDPKTGEARVKFKPDQNVTDLRSFTVTIEPEGADAATPEGPTVLRGE